MTGFESKRQAAQDKMALADAYASAVAETPHMPTPLERRLSTERIERARNALEAALEQQQDKLTDDAQVYIAEYEAALLVSYQSGFSDGKRSAQRKPLSATVIGNMMPSSIPMEYDGPLMEFARAVEAAHNIKEQP